MRIVVISAHETFREQVQAACLRYKESLITLRSADTIGQGMELAEQLEAQVAIIDLAGSVEAGVMAIETLAVVKDRLVVASADVFTTDLMSRAIRAGAHEILEQPVSAEEVHEILAKAARLLSPETPTTPQRNGRLIVCFSSKGGVGKTTTACNLAVTLARRYEPGRIAIVDANQQVPNVAPMLDLRPQFWLRDAVREYRRLDGSMLEQFMTPHPSGLSVLAHGGDAAIEQDFTEDQLCKVLLVCKGRYDITIVDTFPLLTSLNLAIMDLADRILLVTEAVTPAVRTALSNLRLLRQAGYGPGRIELVLNRYTRFKGNVTPEMVAEILDWPVEVIVPYDVHATIAANQGRTVVDMFPARSIARAFEDLAARLLGGSLPQPRPVGAWDRLTRLLG